jgi:hypothetical protein
MQRQPLTGLMCVVFLFQKIQTKSSELMSSGSSYQAPIGRASALVPSGIRIPLASSRLTKLWSIAQCATYVMNILASMKSEKLFHVTCRRKTMNGVRDRESDLDSNSNFTDGQGKSCTTLDKEL